MKYADVTVSGAPATAYTSSNRSLVDPNNFEDLENSIVDRYSLARSLAVGGSLLLCERSFVVAV